MRIRRYLRARDFLKEHLPLLSTDEASNNLMIGLLQGIAAGPDKEGDACLMYAFFKDEKPFFLCMQTPPHHLITYAPEPLDEQEMQIIIANMKGLHPGIPGVHGRPELAQAFAKAWAGNYTVDFEQQVLKLDKVEQPRPAPGEWRKALSQEEQLAAEWLQAFATEAQNESMSSEAALQKARGYIQAGILYFWVDKEPVCMLATNRETPNGRIIAYVYTPLEKRGKGYASNLTAVISEKSLKEGKAFCALFTDSANPTSNKIYRSVGYRPHSLSTMISWKNEG